MEVNDGMAADTVNSTTLFGKLNDLCIGDYTVMSVGKYPLVYLLRKNEDVITRYIMEVVQIWK